MSTTSIPPQTADAWAYWSSVNKNILTAHSTPIVSDIMPLKTVDGVAAVGATPAVQASAWHMGISLSSIKMVASFTSINYILAWSTQVNTKTAPAAGNVQLQWFAPMWVAADPTGSYVNYICQNTISAGTTAGTTTATSTLLAAYAPKDLVVSS